MSNRYSHPWARYRSVAGFTQAEVAERLGVTRHYIIRLEQSLFWHPPDSLMVKLAGLYDIELGEFEMQYYNYVRKQREAFGREKVSFKEFFLGEAVFLKIHPLVRYRAAWELSRMGLCKAICLHYDPISEYEMNKQRDVPEQLKEACEEMKWDWEPLAEAVAQWRRLGYADVK